MISRPLWPLGIRVSLQHPLTQLYGTARLMKSLFPPCQRHYSFILQERTWLRFSDKDLLLGEAMVGIFYIGITSTFATRSQSLCVSDDTLKISLYYFFLDLLCHP